MYYSLTTTAEPFLSAQIIMVCSYSSSRRSPCILSGRPKLGKFVVPLHELLPKHSSLGANHNRSQEFRRLSYLGNQRSKDWLLSLLFILEHQSCDLPSLRPGAKIQSRKASCYILVSVMVLPWIPIARQGSDDLLKKSHRYLTVSLSFHTRKQNCENSDGDSYFLRRIVGPEKDETRQLYDQHVTTNSRTGV